MTKQLTYEWRLREQMAAAGMFSTTKLIPLLADRGVVLSASQVYRLVAERPERLNLQVLVALTDILGCSTEDLIVRVEQPALIAPVAIGEDTRGSATDALRSSGHRPARARLTD